MDKEKLTDALKHELEQRKSEDERMRERLEAKKSELEAIRQNIEKTGLRKIKPIDKVFTKREQKKDEKELEQFRRQEESKIREDRVRRRNDILWANKWKLAIVTMGLFGVISIFSIAENGIREQEISDHYDSAVTAILEGKYTKAEKELDGIDKDDAEALYDYCELQSNLDNYKGEVDVLLERMVQIDGIENEEVDEQYEYACEQIKDVREIQEKINSLGSNAAVFETKDEILGIESEIEALDERYANLIVRDGFDSALATAKNLENETRVGKTMKAIYEIGDVTLDSEEQIEAVRAQYNVLSDKEKEEVVNYGDLSFAEAELNGLKIEAKAKLKKEKQKKKAEQNKAKEEKQAEQTEKEAEETDIVNEQVERTVFRTATGDRYHASGCRYLHGGGIETTISKARAMGLTPCSRCHPDW